MTVREQLLPSAMVPGLVTIEDKDGKQKNVYPVDAKELINSGDYTLVENGSVEAARIAATPLRSGMAAGIPDGLIVAEISGIEGRVLIADTEENRDKILKMGANADAVPSKMEDPKTRAEHEASAGSDKKAEERKPAPAGGQSSGAADKK